MCVFQNTGSTLVLYPTGMPDILVDPDLGNHEYMAANGLKFHYVVKGERTKPLMLMLHGFPEVRTSY